MQRTDLLSIDHAHEIYDGDQLRNINSYEYLRNIVGAYQAAFPKLPNPSLTLTAGELDRIEPFASLVEFFNKPAHQQYDPTYPYGDLYTKFLLELEKNIERLNTLREQLSLPQEVDPQRQQLYEAMIRDKELQKAISENMKQLLAENPNSEFVGLWRLAKKTADEAIKKYDMQLANPASNVIATILDNCIDAVYANPNQGLERAAKMIEGVLESGVHQSSSKVEDRVRARMKGNATKGFDKFKNDVKYLFRQRLNQTTPQHEGSDIGRFSAMVSNTFKPQTTTSMSSVRTYSYNTAEDGEHRNEYPVEYRFGTQGQYDHKQARVSPLFESWLSLQARKYPAEDGQRKISHIYFNNLGRDRSDWEGKREAGLTEELHKLEERHSNVAVITLPADKGFFDKKLLEKHQRRVGKFNAFQQMLDVAKGASDEKIQDFYISPDVKKLLYGEADDGIGWNKYQENVDLSRLLEKSFDDLGFKDVNNISPAEMQAVYFHFIKYELTNFIIDKLQPVSFNMSCKDAIDRGGVSSAYYNLMKSLETDHPLNKDEFHRALHAAPTLVKGRGMNHHTRLIWNAVDKYLDEYQKKNQNDPQKLEKVEWLVEWRDNNSPKHSKVYEIQKLEAYIHDRSDDNRNRHSMFSGHNKDTKISAANKLLDLIKHPEKEVKFTKKENAALQQGRLGAICKEMQKLGIYSKGQIVLENQPELAHTTDDHHRPRRNSV